MIKIKIININENYLEDPCYMIFVQKGHLWWKHWDTYDNNAYSNMVDVNVTLCTTFPEDFKRVF